MEAKVLSATAPFADWVRALDELLSPVLRQKILARIVPTREEIGRQNQVTSSLVEALGRRAKAIGLQYSFIEPQGSTGRKQTQLRGAADIDLFVGLRPGDYSDILALQTKERHQSLDDLLNRLVETWFTPAAKDLRATNVRKTYSQHPFLSLVMKGLDVDIIGCFDIPANELANTGPVTAVDRTVHHTRYIVANLNDRMREDVRILKSFVRTSHAYGDIAALGKMGFTGYSLELAVIMTGGLDSAIAAIRDLNEAPLDPMQRSIDTLHAIAQFKDDYVFIIDPTDMRRNVASSFTRRSCLWLSRRINELIEKAQGGKRDLMEFFIERPIPVEPLPERAASHALAFEFVSDESVHYTVLRDKLYRIAAKIESELEREKNGERRFGKVLTEVYFEGTRFSLGILVERPEIPAMYPRRGPSTSLDGPCVEFRNAHPDAYEKDGHLWVDEQRQWTSASDLSRAIIEEHRVRGLEPSSSLTDVSRRVLYILSTYVMPLETEFSLENEEEFKRANAKPSQ